MESTNFNQGRFTIKKTITSSDIKTATDLDVTQVLQGAVGAIIKDVVVRTDGTGLADGTNVSLKVSDGTTAIAFFTEAVANLGADAIVDLANASVTGIKAPISYGEKVVIDCTVADCTGDGTIDVYIEFEKLDTTVAIRTA